MPKIFKNVTDYFDIESKDKHKCIKIDLNEALITCDTENISPIHSERYLNQLSIYMQEQKSLKYSFLYRNIEDNDLWDLWRKKKTKKQKHE